MILLYRTIADILQDLSGLCEKLSTEWSDSLLGGVGNTTFALRVLPLMQKAWGPLTSGGHDIGVAADAAESLFGEFREELQLTVP